MKHCPSPPSRRLECDVDQASIRRRSTPSQRSPVPIRPLLVHPSSSTAWPRRRWQVPGGPFSRSAAACSCVGLKVHVRAVFLLASPANRLVMAREWQEPSWEEVPKDVRPRIFDKIIPQNRCGMLPVTSLCRSPETLQTPVYVTFQALDLSLRNPNTTPWLARAADSPNTAGAASSCLGHLPSPSFKVPSDVAESEAGEI
jgi:hypothetical protein